MGGNGQASAQGEVQVDGVVAGEIVAKRQVKDLGWVRGRRVDVDGIFGDDYSASWAGDFLAGRVRPRKLAASQKIAARIKLLWIALAAHNPAAANDVLR